MKFTSLSTVNILEMMTDSENIITIKYDVMHRFQYAYLHLTLTHSKCQGQGYAPFDSKLLEKKIHFEG